MSVDRTVDTDRSPWAGIFALDVVSRITAIHLGLEYRGEVLRAALWSRPKVLLLPFPWLDLYK